MQYEARILGADDLATLRGMLSGGNLRQLGAPPAALALNVGSAALLACGAWLLTRALGNPAQWASLALGGYAATSWAQTLALRDRPAFALIFRTPALHCSNLGFAFLDTGAMYRAATWWARS